MRMFFMVVFSVMWDIVLPILFLYRAVHAPDLHGVALWLGLLIIVSSRHLDWK